MVVLSVVVCLSLSSETDHRVLLLGRCVTSLGFFDGRGETLGWVLLTSRALGTA